MGAAGGDGAGSGEAAVSGRAARSRDNWLSNRVFKSYDDLVDHGCETTTLATKPIDLAALKDTLILPEIAPRRIPITSRTAPCRVLMAQRS